LFVNLKPANNIEQGLTIFDFRSGCKEKNANQESAFTRELKVTDNILFKKQPDD